MRDRENKAMHFGFEKYSSICISSLNNTEHRFHFIFTGESNVLMHVCSFETWYMYVIIMKQSILG